MRLIQVSSVNDQEGPLILKDIPADRIHDYPFAILSHTWGDDEVVFPDIHIGNARAKRSFSKVAFTCRQAAQDGLGYAWIDSCCIDKSSSAELTEAINSMFPWYRMAAKCYALLEDYDEDRLVPSKFMSCRWFTRGWTLQELLAPSTVSFHSASGHCIGTRETLCRCISDVTRIDTDILTGQVALGTASVAKRMSWAAERQTTRLEDAAYCLLGIFDVNMPMLYGEGTRAFIRLQEEIMKTTDDESLFAWCDPSAPQNARHGLLSTSPRFFAASRSFIPYQDWGARPPFQMTNRGLQIALPVAPTSTSHSDLYLAALNCPVPPDYINGRFLAIYLKKLPGGGNHYARVRAGEFARVDKIQSSETIHVRQTFETAGVTDDMRVWPQHAIQLRGGPCMTAFPSVSVIAPESGPQPLQGGTAPSWPGGWRSSLQWGQQRSQAFHYNTCRLPRAPGQAACGLLFTRFDGRRVLVIIGSEKLFTAGFCAVELPAALSGAPNIQADELQPLFIDPEPFGGEIELSGNLVSVDSTTMAQGSWKYLLVDIRIEPLAWSERNDSTDEEGNATVPGQKKGSRWGRILPSSLSLRR